MRPEDDRFPTSVLTDEEVDRFRSEGFLLLDRPVISLDALEEARVLLDRLFARFDSLPSKYAKDLTEGARSNEHPRIPEIVQTAQLAPRLQRSEIMKTCTAIARQLYGPSARLLFDHAIYKPPFNEAATAWHQDAAYGLPGEMGGTIWVPLQSVGPEGGCMRFVPGSHRDGLQEHAHLASESNPGLLGAGVSTTDVAVCPVQAGGLTVHDMFTLHSTGPNRSSTFRRVWVLNFSHTAPVPGAGARAKMRLGAALGRARSHLPATRRRPAG